MTLARLGPPMFVDLAPGAELVLVPLVASGCFGVVPPKNGFRKHCRCELRARNGRLTCLNHRRLEMAAQRLKAAASAAKDSA